MQPIFKEYAHFLHDNGCDISWFQERTYWLDHNIVKAFTRGGQRLISLYKIAVSDDLTVALTKHKQNVDGLQFESWDETIARFRPHLESIERDSIALLPIRQWSEFDIWLYILSEDIEINDKYRYGYDRVGCGIACPNYTKYTWVLDKYWYPYLFNRWRNILRNDFINNNKWLIMNCTVDEYVTKAWTGGVYRDEPTEEVISEFSQYSGLDIPIARKYFNRYCANGCINKRRQPLRIKDRNALAMNMKMFGRNINHFLCKKCLMKEFGWSKSQWDEKVNEFKEQGCQLF